MKAKHGAALLWMFHSLIHIPDVAAGALGEIRRTGQYGGIIWPSLMTIKHLSARAAGGKQDSD